MNGVNTTVLGGIAGLAKNVNIENCESAGVLKNGNNLCVGAVGGFVAYAKKAVAISGNSSCTASFEMKKLSDNLFWGLAFGNVTENAAIDGASFSCSANIDGAELELTADNFMGYLCNTASKVQPTVRNCTWSK